MNLKHIIKHPVVTEKSLINAADNKYTFVVDSRSSKGQIQAAVEAYFSVNVPAIRTLRLSGENRRTGKRRLPAHTKEVKKAIVTLKPGQSINAFEITG